MTRVVVLLGLLAASATLAVSAATATVSPHVLTTPATAPFRTAIFDPASFSGPSAPAAFAKTAAAGAGFVRVVANWRFIAPTQPGNESDPSDPGYHWAALDSTVSAAVAAGLSPILDVYAAPAWALVPGTAHGNYAGNPKAAAVGRFARALATHYDGNHGAPRVSRYEVWNEPNLSLYLSTAASPGNPAGTPTARENAYRNIVNQFAAAAHAVNAANLVVAGALDPFVNTRSQFNAVAPLVFMRGLLCLSNGSRPHATCSAQTHFDVWSHHPYTYGAPLPGGHARLSGDVSVGDLGKMATLLQGAAKLRHVLPAQAPQFWVTEFGWNTNPPRPDSAHAAPVGLVARWLSESFYEMWQSGVTLATWNLLADGANGSTCVATVNPCYASGLYSHAGLAKETLSAFRFPFVAFPAADGKHAAIWGRDPSSTKKLVTIQLKNGSSWALVTRIWTNAAGIFQGTVNVGQSQGSLRAVTSDGVSHTFSLTEPSAPAYSPFA